MGATLSTDFSPFASWHVDQAQSLVSSFRKESLPFAADAGVCANLLTTGDPTLDSEAARRWAETIVASLQTREQRGAAGANGPGAPVRINLLSLVAGIIFFENTKGHAAPVPGDAVAEAEAEAEVKAKADASLGASPTTPADGKAGAWGFGPTSPEPAGGADVDVRRKLSLLFDAFDFMQAGPATRIPPPHPALYPFKLHPTPT